MRPTPFCNAELQLPSLEVFNYDCHVLAQHPFHWLPISISIHDYLIVSICILSGDGGRQVRDVDVEERGRQDRPLWDAVPEASQPAPFAVSGGKGKAAIFNHLHDHADHVSIRQQSQQLAGEAAVPYSVVGCCEVVIEESHANTEILKHQEAHRGFCCYQKL